MGLGILVGLGGAAAVAATPPEVWAKVGVGIPGVPSGAAEVVLTGRQSLVAEGGTGPIGAYGTLGWHHRPCWGCESGPGFALGLGPELTLIPRGEDSRTGFIATATAEPALVWRFSDHLGGTLGLKVGLGPEVDLRHNADGTTTRIGPELALLGALYIGVRVW